METRIKNIFNRLEEEVDAIFLFNSTKPHLDLTFFYVTGLIEGQFEGSGVLISPNGTGEIVTTRLEEESAKKSDLPVTAVKKKEEREEWMEDNLAGFDRIGVNATELTYHAYNKISDATDAEIIDVSDAIIDARNVKDDEEIERLEKACDIASEVAEEITDFIEEGVREYEIAAELSYMMRKKGATGEAFETISSSGPNTAEPHYTCGERKIEKGDFVLLDFGALHDRYRSDITRTYVVGEATDKQRRMYQVVQEAQQAALDKIGPGIKGEEVHNTAAEVIDDTEFEGRFTHGLGHSLGLSTHDGSGLSPSVDVTLEQGMVFTVEPGIYLPDEGGVRIEDDIVVTDDGCRVLTCADKRFKVI